MKQLLSILCLSVLVCSCGKGDQTCKTYADLEWKCGDYPESEKEITLKLAEGMCQQAMSSKEADELTAMFRQEVECAKKSKDCAAYNACKDASEEK